MKLLAFDLEISTIIPAGENWELYRPFGISVAATLASDGQQEELTLWYGQGRPDGTPWPEMPPAQVQVLVRYLLRMMEDGFTIITWNGLGFDFRTLAEESGLWDECMDLALGRHIDPMFHFFCEKGFAIGLNAAAQGMGLEGKTEGMDGALAPVLWEEGRYDEVKAYVEQDVRTTLEVFQEIERLGYLYWISSTGRGFTWAPAARKLLTAKEAMDLPLPTPPGWIDDPWPREQFTAWVLPVGGA